MPILECDDLRKTFAGGFEAVRGVTFGIEEGEAFGLLGPNGAGKTTTMRMLGTLLPPTSGRASVAGHDVVREAGAVRRAIGFAMQEAGLARYATGREHLHMMGRLYGLSRAQTRSRADELLVLFGLVEAADRQVRTYSGGMRRRIDLACGLVHRPRLLFLDEPTTGVDPTSRAALWEELRRLQADGVSLFLTTHYLEDADRLCDRLAIVDRGVIVARGTPDELKAEVGADVVTVGLMEDIDTGFFDKLRVAPISRAAIVLGLLLTDATRLGVQSLVVLLIALVLGAHIVTGVLGLVGILALAAIFGAAWSGISLNVALRTRNPEVTAAAGVLTFPLYFGSTAFMPHDLLPHWLHVFNVVNPINYLITVDRAGRVAQWNSWMEKRSSGAAGRRGGRCSPSTSSG